MLPFLRTHLSSEGGTGALQVRRRILQHPWTFCPGSWGEEPPGAGGQLQPLRSSPRPCVACGGLDAEVTSLVVQSTCAPSPGLTGPQVQWKQGGILRLSNQSQRGGAVPPPSELRHAQTAGRWQKIWKNVDQHSDWELQPGCSPPLGIPLWTMWQLERPGSGRSPPRLLLLVYTSLCALGGECFPLSVCVCVCCFDSRGAVPFVGGAETLPESGSSGSPLWLQFSLLNIHSRCFQSPSKPGFGERIPASMGWRMGRGGGRSPLITARSGLTDAPVGCALRCEGWLWPRENASGWTVVLPSACLCVCFSFSVKGGKDKKKKIWPNLFGQRCLSSTVPVFNSA